MNVQDFFNVLKENNINCFCGVPDSLLKDFCAYITDNTTPLEHTITANEGNAVALAAGHYLASGNPALVYMQNSGIGNCVNPLLSLTDEDVYNIPLLMIIGWRGEPGQKDEPQHIKQGKLTEKLLDTMGIKYNILPKSFEEAKPLISQAFIYMRETNKPFAFIIKKGTFEKYELKYTNNYELLREESIECIIKHLNIKDIIVSTTGHISREVYETRERLGQQHKQDFLTVGSMGHSSSIALGIAIEHPERNIYCFDGDGALLMHQGAIVVNASKKLKNFKHIIFNNEAHDSVGAQPTAINNAQIDKLVLYSGYDKTYSVSNKKDLETILPEFINNKCTSLLEIKVKCGARKDLGRPKERPIENKEFFMQNLNQIEFIKKGAITNLTEILKIEKPENILIFTGKKSYESIRETVELNLKGYQYSYYNDFSSNPKIEELERAINQITRKYDLIIAIGGGSVIDFAKIYKYKTGIKTLIAIPTTCGTGSEATQFAVYYKEGKKYSLDAKNILPEYSIVDSQFVEKNPKNLKICTTLDALCQAIESFWAVRSTPQSRKYAEEAMLLIKNNIVKYVNSNDPDAAEQMAYAANLAGKAINISRTTAAHALSYKITSEYGIPHGLACAITIAKLIELNSQIDNNTNQDKRGVDFVVENIKKIYRILDFTNPTSFFNKLFLDMGLDMDSVKKQLLDINNIIDSVNIERLNNNPKKLSKQELRYLLNNIQNYAKAQDDIRFIKF